jgi:hypothetical protein
VKPVLEVNAEHPLVKKLEAREHFHDLAHILFDQALLAEGGLPEDPAAYVKRVNALLVWLARQAWVWASASGRSAPAWASARAWCCTIPMQGKPGTRLRAVPRQSPRRRWGPRCRFPVRPASPAWRPWR